MMKPKKGQHSNDETRMMKVEQPTTKQKTATTLRIWRRDGDGDVEVVVVVV